MGLLGRPLLPLSRFIQLRLTNMMLLQRRVLVRALLLLSWTTSTTAFSRNFLSVAAAAAVSSTALALSSGSQKASETSPVHLIVLVHGWLGNSDELGYLERSLVKEAEQYPSARFVVYSAKNNDGQTKDGIAAGGSRLAEEVLELIQSSREHDKKVTLSFVGNSLGGLYARFALSKLPLSDMSVEPMVFCTTATPHLGVSEHTYLPIPRWAEKIIGNLLQDTGRDLFRHTPLIEEMAFDPAYREPLQRFKKRIAYANAYATDFQVPTTTAAFLSSKSSHFNHKTVGKADSVFPLTVETPHDPNHEAANDTMAHALDSMGWTKVFCDNRDNIPLPALPLPFNELEIPFKPEWSSQELIDYVATVGSQLNFPLGHTVLVANSKSHWYARLNERGQPVVDRMASTLIDDILSFSSQQCKQVPEQ